VYEDSVYRFDGSNTDRQFIFSHNCSTLKIEFCSGDNINIADESWGLDNILISDLNIPASSSWGLAILALLVLTAGTVAILRPGRRTSF
jgi:hypothetical protein